jgi:hypothetical protein
VLSVFNGLTGADVNGTWSLYIVDDASGDAGTLSGGWSLSIEFGDDYYEQNDTRATAWHPGYDWEQTWLSDIAGLGVKLDDDWYRIDVSSGSERVQVDLLFTHADGDIDVCLVDGSGVGIACSDSTTDNEFIDTEVPGPGTYYIRVYLAIAGNTYDLWWDDRQEDDAYEPNDTLEFAWYPGYDWEQTWLLSINGLGVQLNDDWYEIDVDPGYEHVQIDLRFTHADGDIDVCLVDGSGFNLACSSSTTDNEFIETEVPGPGTYYIWLYGFWGATGNTYDLWWDDISVPIIDDNYEENDTLATAWHPGYDWEQTWLSDIAGLGVQADEDWYEIDVSPGFEHVQVDVRFTHADGDIDVGLVDGSGALLAESISESDNEFIDTEVPGPGTYYILVTFENAGNTYDLWWSDVCLLDDVQCLISWYYKSILDRDPEPGGAEGWTAEIERIVSLGIDIKEGFIALGKLFFNSGEYLAMGKEDNDYIIDLYETFLHRTPSQGEVDDWASELSGGLTRNLLLNYFIFSAEFRTYMEGIFGPSSTRPEYSLVNDLYRGFLSRLPEDSGFNDWLALMQEAQCTGEQAVRDLTNQIGLLFIQSAEYEARNPELGNPDFSSEFVTNLYDAVLRRGAELANTPAFCWL